jgi:hypothetical protein
MNGRPGNAEPQLGASKTGQSHSADKLNAGSALPATLHLIG